MTRIITIGALAVSCLGAPGATVAVYLESSAAGQVITPGTQVEWSITFAVSTGGNVGLALLVADLVQDPTNPEKLNIPPGNAASIGATMDDFSRPLGVSNAGEGGATTGYIGVQRGAPGTMNLVQIGGGQNTFGGAGPPGLGQDFSVNAGVGQGPTPQLLLSGSFPAPATHGPHTFRRE